MQGRRQKSQKDQEAEAQVNMVLVGIQANVRKIPRREVGCGVTPTEQSGPGEQRRDIHRPKASGVSTVQVNCS